MVLDARVMGVRFLALCLGKHLKTAGWYYPTPHLCRVPQSHHFLMLWLVMKHSHYGTTFCDHTLDIISQVTENNYDCLHNVMVILGFCL